MTAERPQAALVSRLERLLASIDKLDAADRRRLRVALVVRYDQNGRPHTGAAEPHRLRL